MYNSVFNSIPICGLITIGNRTESCARCSRKILDPFHKKGIDIDTMPLLNQPVGETVRYHIRTSRHDVTIYDWQQYLAFAAEHGMRNLPATLTVTLRPYAW